MEFHLDPAHTGLPFVIWIEPGAENTALIRLDGSAKAMTALSLVTSWYELNWEALVSYWNREIDTQDVIVALRRNN